MGVLKKIVLPLEVATPEPTSQRLQILSKVVLLVLSFCVMFTMLMPSCFKTEGMSSTCRHPGLPGGAVFDVFEVLVVGYLGGVAVGRLGLPPLLGMLIAGYCLKNIIPDQLDGIDAKTNGTLRNVALAIIMLRAGMGLDVRKLCETPIKTFLMSTVPCCVEAATIAGMAKLFFPFMSIPFCFMLGFCIADVSPAVTTPILLDFMDKRLGEKKGIPTILLAAGSVNSVIAIVLYSVVNEFAWTDSVSMAKLAEIIGMKLVLQIVGVGCIAGYVSGRLLERSWQMVSSAQERFALLFLVAMFILFGFKTVGMGGGGTLAVLTCGATLQNTLVDKSQSKPVSEIMGKIWTNVGSVMLFTLLGSSVDQSKMEASKILLGSVIIMIGLLGRGIATFFTSSMYPWSLKERAFAMITWCPKATVQAALATVSLDHVNSMIQSGQWSATDPYTLEMLERANVILTTAVLSIIFTAPLFAVLMSVTGPMFLEQSPMPCEPTKADIEFGAVKDVDLSVIKEIAMPVDTTLAV